MADLKRNRRTVQQLLAAAANDTDAASIFYNGAGLADYDSAIVVIKGRENVDYVVTMLERQQLTTPGKPVEGSAAGGAQVTENRQQENTHGSTLDSRNGASPGSEGLLLDVQPDLSATESPNARGEVRPEGGVLVHELAGHALDGVATRANALAMLPRIDAAIQRIVNGQGCMRIPADLEDPDLVLADCKRLLRHVCGVSASHGQTFCGQAPMEPNEA